MTEEEAKTKWCPFANVGSTTSGLGGFNRFIPPVGSGSDESVRCIGSDCMAWRWEARLLGHDIEHQKATHGAIKGAVEHARFCREHPLLGFCGLAGRP